MDTVRYLSPKRDPTNGQTLFSGWARMAVPIPSGGLRVMEVKKVGTGLWLTLDDGSSHWPTHATFKPPHTKKKQK